jgi:hypothetical protein
MTLDALNLAEQTLHITPEVLVDITSMRGMLNGSTDYYLRVDTIAEEHNKQIHHFFNSEPHQEYFAARIKATNAKKLFSNFENSSLKPTKQSFSKIKSNYYVDNVRYNKSDLDYLAYKLYGRGSDMKAEVKGTYIHRDLMLLFFRWISAELAVQMDDLFMELLSRYSTLKIERKGTIDFFHELIQVSNQYYVKKQPEGYPQEYANQRLMNMLNIEVLGCKASTYKRRNGITSTVTRDWLTPKQLTDIKRAEKHVIGMIQYGGIYDYESLQVKLHDLMVNR